MDYMISYYDFTRLVVFDYPDVKNYGGDYYIREALVDLQQFGRPARCIPRKCGQDHQTRPVFRTAEYRREHLYTLGLWRESLHALYE